MTSGFAIRAESLGKKYLIGHQAKRERYVALRDVIVHSAKNAWLKTTEMVRGREMIIGNTVEEFWALRDVSFEVQRGEVLGIIGRNGAGKSTLLKILSRITEPSAGRVTINGRVASLLEVGTGFHPELTGRENIYLNGSILGMTRAEIKRRFDEIVAFAEVGRFLDTPVKRYSSGMYVRLAFAVAAHLEPEILIVDEVLAVGDIAFQNKCLGKIKEVSHSDQRTVLFVSHDVGAIQSLCSRALVMSEGGCVFDGAAQDAVQAYLKSTMPRAEARDTGSWLREGTGEARILSISLEDEAGLPQTQFRMGEPLVVVVTAHFPKEIKNPTFGVNIVTDTGVRVADCRTSHYGLSFGIVMGTVEYRMRIDVLTLYPRTYSLEPWLADSACLSDFDWVQNAVEFDVTSGPKFLAGANVNGKHGIAFIPTFWAMKIVE